MAALPIGRLTFCAAVSDNRNIGHDEKRGLCPLLHFSDPSGAGGAGAIGTEVRSAADILKMR